MIFIIILLITILGFLSIYFRHQVANLAGTAVDYTVGTWYRIWPAVRTALIVGGIGWGVLIVLMLGIGAYANSIEAALIISILFPFWFLSMLIPRRTPPVPFLAKWKIPIFGIVRVVGGIVLIIASLSLAFGIWSPGSKDALDERHEDVKVAAENSIRKGHEQSERNAGVRGWIINDTHLYDETYTAVQSLKKDEEIYITNIKGGKSANKQREAVLPAMLKNKDGDFFRGREGWVPTMNIGWEKPNNTEVPRAPTKDSAVSVSSESWKLCWKKPEGYAGVSDLRELCGITEIKRDKDSLVATFHSENGSAILKGVSSDGKKYQGIWEDRFYKGEFFLDFLSENSATGYSTDEGSKVRKDILATKI